MFDRWRRTFSLRETPAVWREPRIITFARVTADERQHESQRPFSASRCPILVAALSGHSVRDFLRRRQLPYAAHLLTAAPNRSVKDVAIASGFGTASTFHRSFKAAYAISPAEYRSREVVKCGTANR